MARYRQYKKKPINLLPKETKDYYLGLTLQGIDSKVRELNLEIKNYEDNRAKVKELELKILRIETKENELRSSIKNKIDNELPPLKFDIFDIFHPDQKFERRSKVARLTESEYLRVTEGYDYKRLKDELKKEMDTLSAKYTFPSKAKNILAAIPEIKKRIKKKEKSAKIARLENKTRGLGSSIIKKIKKATEYPFVCPYCCELTYQGDDHVDHINPIVNGGLSIDNNMVLVCENCNIKKGSKPLRKFCRENSLDFNGVCDRLENMGKWV